MLCFLTIHLHFKRANPTTNPKRSNSPRFVMQRDGVGFIRSQDRYHGGGGLHVRSGTTGNGLQRSYDVTF